MIDEPRQWAYLVAFGPLTILVAFLFIIYSFATDTLNGTAFGLIVIMGFLSWPAVLVGMYLDRRLLENEFEITQLGLLWDVFAVACAPIVGTLYLWRRRVNIRHAAGASA